jgi:hypothetical protein
MTNPVAFGRSNRVKSLAMAVAREAGHPSFWQLEAAAMLSQIGYISLPPELVEKLHYGTKLTVEENALAAGAPAVAQTLLGRIPRLEPVLEILALSQKPTGVSADGLMTLGANILRLVSEYDTQVVQGNPTALQGIRAKFNKHDGRLVEHLFAAVGEESDKVEMCEVAVGNVTIGMIILDDVRTPVGVLLVPKGFEVTDVFIQRMRNFGPVILAERIRVAAPSAPASRSAKAPA